MSYVEVASFLNDGLVGYFVPYSNDGLVKMLYRLYHCSDSVGDTVKQKHPLHASLRGTKQPLSYANQRSKSFVAIYQPHLGHHKHQGP